MENQKTSLFDRLDEYSRKKETGENVSDFSLIPREQYESFKAQTKPKESIRDFDTDPEVIKRAERFQDYISNNQGFMTGLLDSYSSPSEMLRDDNIKIVNLFSKANVLKDAPDQIKQDYQYLRDRFSEADIKGFAEWSKTVKDYGLDIVSDPLSMPFLLATFFSGGVAPATVHTGVRKALHSSLQKGAAALSSNTAKAGTAYGAGFGGTHNFATQEVQMALGEREELSFAELGLSTAAGGAFGYGTTKFLNWAGTKVSNKLNERRLRKDIEIDHSPVLSESKGLELVEEGIQGEFIPASTNKVLEQTDRLLSGTTVNVLDVNSPAWKKATDEFVKDLGGGDKTKAELDDLVLSTMNSGATGKELRNKIAFEVYKLGTDTLGKLAGGKAAGILTPYTSFSNTAKTLRQRLAYEFGIDPLKKSTERVGFDFSEIARRYTGNFNQRYISAVQPLALNTLKGTLSDTVNATLNRAIRGEMSSDKNINVAALKIQNLFKDIGDELLENGLIDKKIKNYIPRMWNRKAIENNKLKFANLLVEEGQAKNADEGIKMQANL